MARGAFVAEVPRERSPVRSARAWSGRQAPSPGPYLNTTGVTGQTVKTLALDLHYLVTAYPAGSNGDLTPETLDQHRILGLAVQTLHDNGLMDGAEFGWNGQFDRDVSITLQTDTSEEASVSLGGGATTTETFTVQTTAGDAGEYTATAASEDSQDSTPVVVQDDSNGGSDPAAFNVTITKTNAPVEEGETLQVEVNISNTGGTEATRTVTTEVGGLGSIETTVTLAANESATESFTLETAPGDTGEYEATAATETDQDNALLAVTPSAGQ